MTMVVRASRYAWINLASVLGTITVNALANIIPFNGQNTGQISDRFQVYFVPAGYVFAIWGVIYLAWIAFCAYQLWPRNREHPLFAALGYWFALSGVFNSLWLVCWHYNWFTTSLLVMIALLLTLIVSYERLGVGRTPGGLLGWAFVDVPFGLYLGWISVALIANASDVLWLNGWGAWGIAPQVWTAIMLAVASGIGAAMVWKRHDIVFPLVLAWAFNGIAHRQSSRFALPDPQLVIDAAQWSARFAILLAVIAVLLRLRRNTSS